MQTSTFAWWRWRLRQATGRNPLVRTSDRVEAISIAIAVFASAVAIPIAGGITTAIHDERADAYAAEVHHHSLVEAQAVSDSVTLPKSGATVVQARWQFGGLQHTDRFEWQHPVRAGQTIGIWVEPDGRSAQPLDPWWRAGLEAAVAGVSFWLAVTATAAAFAGLLRPWLRRVRSVAWDRDIASLADGGGTTKRHS